MVCLPSLSSFALFVVHSTVELSTGNVFIGTLEPVRAAISESTGSLRSNGQVNTAHELSGRVRRGRTGRRERHRKQIHSYTETRFRFYLFPIPLTFSFSRPLRLIASLLNPQDQFPLPLLPSRSIDPFDPLLNIPHSSTEPPLSLARSRR